MFCGGGEASGQKFEMGDEEPSGFGGSRSFEVFGKAAASAKPGEGAFDDPAARQKLEAFDTLRSLNDLNRPRSAMGERGYELIAAVNSVGKDMAQLGEPASQPLQQRNSPMAILNVGGMNVDGKQKAIGVGDDMALAPVDTFAGIVASGTAGLALDRRVRRKLFRQGTPLAAGG